MQLRDIMNTRVVTIEPDASADSAWTRMRRRDVRHLVVMDGPELVGVLSERDLGGRTGGSLRKGRLVKQLMTPTVTTAAPDTSLESAADLMRRQLIGSLPVMDGDELVGIVTATDIFDELGGETSGRLSSAERQLLRAPSTSKRLGGAPVPRTRANADGASRKRARPAETEKRVPLAAEVPKAVKREAGRTTTSLVPANIRVHGVELDDGKKEFIRKRLGMRLGKFARHIERVSVRLRDVNGPKGGVDHVCTIKVVLTGLPSVVIESQAATVEAAFIEALDRVEGGVRRSVQKRRTKPLKAGAGATRRV